TTTLSFFLLTIQPPQRSTLFPTRRSSDLRRHSDNGRDGRVPNRRNPSAVPAVCRSASAFPQAAAQPHGRTRRGRSASWSRGDWRSEEHTSELQSRGHLVCRLLLEKKKQRK